MTDEYLTLISQISQMTPEAAARWYEHQVLTARYLRNGLANIMGLGSIGNGTTKLPDDHEIVSETLIRIQNNGDDSRYVWDGKTPPTFNKFFAVCMKITLSSLRSRERRFSIKRELQSKLTIDFASTMQEVKNVLHEGRGATLAAMMIEGSRMRGKTLEYAKRLDFYAATSATVDEIAADLGVEPATVESYRKRIRSTMIKKK